MIVILSQFFFFWGGEGGGWILQNLISKLTLIIFHPFLPTSSRVLSFNFHINPSQPVAAENHTRFLPIRKIDTWAIGFPQVILHMGNMCKLEPIGFPYVYSWLRGNLWETYGNIWKTHGTPMGKWWFWYSEPASCHRYSMCFPCISTGFPHVTSQLKLNIRKTYGVSTTGHQQKFEKAYVVLISIPQVKNHGIAHLPLDDPCLYPPLCDPLPIISILIILIACDWFICHTYLSVGINPCVYHNWKTN